MNPTPDTEEKEDYTNYLPIPRITLNQMVRDYQTALKEIFEGADMIRAASQRLTATFRPSGLEYEFFSEGYVHGLRHDNKKEVTEKLNQAIWKTLIERMQIRSVMSVKAAEEMDNQVREGKMPPITEVNILATMENICNRIPEFIEQATKEIFEWLRPHEYRMHEYKTNEKNHWELTENIIRTWAVEYIDYGRNPGFRVMHSSQQHLTALDNVFSMLDGTGTIKTYKGPLSDAIEMSGDGRGKTAYFKFKCFKNRNLHLKILRPDLLAKLNAVAGGMRLKDYKTPPKQKAYYQPPEMKVKKVQIPDNVLSILRQSTFEGCVVKLPGELARDLYEAVNKVLVAAGGKWNKSKKGHVFPSDARAALGVALESGQVVNKKQTYQFFATPDDIAHRMVDSLNPEPTGTFLEPSAGSGALIQALFRSGIGIGMGRITAVELDPDKIPALEEMVGKSNVICGDFLKQARLGQFDYIIANPPFNGGQDIAHFRKMFDCLKPKGQMACILSPGWMTNSLRAASDFREWLLKNSQPFHLRGADGFSTDTHSVTLEWLPENAFKESGTSIRTILALLTKV